MLRLVSFLLLVYSYFLIQAGLLKLPSRIPTHFNSAGAVDGWGNPESLWIIFAAQALTCAVFLLVPYLGQKHPNSVHLGLRRLSDFPISQRAGILTLMSEMLGYLSVVLNLFFVLTLHEIIKAAQQRVPHFQMLWLLVLGAGGTFAVLWYYLREFRRIKKGDGGTAIEIMR